MKSVNLKNQIIYDKECPFCSTYINLTKLKKNFDVMIINAREVVNQDDYKDLFENYNIDEGMIFIFNQKIYYGGEAIFKINELLSESNLLKKFNNENVIKILYPLFKFIRGITLKILLRKKILD